MSQNETTKFYRYSAAEEQRIKQAAAKVAEHIQINRCTTILDGSHLYV